jgi:hypothetical protein
MTVPLATWPRGRTALLFAAGLLIALAVLRPSDGLAADAIITDDGTDPDPIAVDVDEALTLLNGTDVDIRLIDDAGRWDSGDLVPGQRFTIVFSDDEVVTFTSEDGRITGTILVGDVELPGAEPTDEPDAEPAGEATPQPAATPEPTSEPTAAPTGEPTGDPTAAPTGDPTARPTSEVTEAPVVDSLAATGLPSAQIAWTAAFLTLVGLALITRPAGRT